MATAVGLSFQLTASSVGMAKGVNDAVKSLGSLGVAAQKAANDLSVIKTIELGRTIVSGLRSLVGTITSYVSQVDQATEATSNLSRELGISFGQLQELQIAAELSGVSAETLARAFTRAQVTISKAASGSKEAAAALSSIGLDPAALQGMGSTEQFVAIAKAISQIENPAQRAAAAVAIFGKSGAELLPVFRELEQNLAASRGLLQQFGGGVTQLEADRVTAIGDAFDLARRALGIFVTKVLAELSPVLIEASNSFVKFLASLDRTQIAASAAAVLKTVSNVMSTLWAIGKLLAPVVGALAKFLQFVGDNSRGAAIGLAAASAALVAYQVGCVIAAIATQGLGAAIRTALSSTGIGALVVVLGLAVGALVEYAIAADEAAVGTADLEGEMKTAAADVKAETEKMAGALASSMEKMFSSAEEKAKQAAEAARREADAAIERMTVERDFGGDSAMASAARAVAAIESDIKRTEEEIAAAREASSRKDPESAKRRLEIERDIAVARGLGDEAAAKAAEERLRAEEQNAAAARAANRDAVDAGVKRLADLDQALEREREIASGQRKAAEAQAKAAEERARKEQEFIRARMAFDEKRTIELSVRKAGPVEAKDVRTAQGFKDLMFKYTGTNELDPAIVEYKKQLKELVAIRRAIEQQPQPDVVQI